MSAVADVVVVGSGASGVVFADTLLKAGLSVCMVDVGDVDRRYAGRIPQGQSYQAIRRTDSQQHEYMLGERFSGVDVGRTGPIAQVTPPRHFVFQKAQEILGESGEHFAAVESLARGGLAEAWGAMAMPYLDRELQRSGLSASQMVPHYQAVAERIGISGVNDDLSEWRGRLDSLQPAIAPDVNATAMLKRYATRRQRIVAAGCRVGRPTMAVLSEPLGERGANPGLHLDFWANPEQSVFRPSVMLAELEKHPRFEYRSGLLATAFREDPDGTASIECQALDGGPFVTVTGRRLALAAGALGTTRIVLRSLNKFDFSVPLVCNEHAYIPSLVWSRLGGPPVKDSHSLAQLTFMYDPSGDQEHLVQAQSYSFAGLPLMRLLKESPLSYRESMTVFRTLSSALVILVVQHEDDRAASKTCRLIRGATAMDDRLEFTYTPTPAEGERQRTGEARMRWLMRQLGCLPLKTVHPGHGSSVHYGGSLCADGKAGTAIDSNGRLVGHDRVVIADGAGLQYLPAKGLTLTLMANAHRMASAMAAELQ